MRRAKRKPRRRSFVMIAVLVIVGSALYVATALLFMAQAEATGAAGAADAAQLRALAWSGLQAVMANLNDQRDVLLKGGHPAIEPEYAIYQTPHQAGVVRVLSWDGSAGPSARRLEPEAGKIDLNTADAAMLARTGKIDPAVAGAIVAYRDGTLHRPFQSVVELLDVPGGVITPQVLFGPIEKIQVQDDAQLGGRSVGERIESRLGDAGASGLADLLTVFSVDVALQQGGERRINLNVPWTDDLGQAITARFDQAAADRTKALMKSGAKLDRPSKIVAALAGMKIPVEQWAVVLDAFTTDAQSERTGLVDINTAPLEALLALPGILPEQASRMVSVRRELTDDELGAVTWPLTSQILDQPAFQGIIDRITTRCWTWRIRIAAGQVAADHPDEPMTSRLVYEAVIDLSSTRPRLAYLREITILQQSAEVAMGALGDRTGPDGPPSETDVAAASERPDATPVAGEPDEATSDPGDDAPRPEAAGENEGGGPAAETPEKPAATQPGATPSAASNSPAKAGSRKTGRWLPG